MEGRALLARVTYAPDGFTYQPVTYWNRSTGSIAGFVRTPWTRLATR
jgi:hypothetical protein